MPSADKLCFAHSYTGSIMTNSKTFQPHTAPEEPPLYRTATLFIITQAPKEPPVWLYRHFHFQVAPPEPFYNYCFFYNQPAPMGHRFVADREKHNNCEVENFAERQINKKKKGCSMKQPRNLINLRLAACPHATYFLFKAPAFPLCLNLCILYLPDGSQG